MQGQIPENLFRLNEATVQGNRVPREDLGSQLGNRYAVYGDPAGAYEAFGGPAGGHTAVG